LTCLEGVDGLPHSDIVIRRHCDELWWSNRTGKAGQLGSYTAWDVALWAAKDDVIDCFKSLAAYDTFVTARLGYHV